MGIHSSFIYNTPKLQGTQMSYDRWVGKQTMVEPHPGILLRNEKEQTIDAHKTLGGSQRHYTE